MLQNFSFLFLKDQALFKDLKLLTRHWRQCTLFTATKRTEKSQEMGTGNNDSAQESELLKSALYR